MLFHRFKEQLKVYGDLLSDPYKASQFFRWG